MTSNGVCNPVAANGPTAENPLIQVFWASGCLRRGLLQAITGDAAKLPVAQELRGCHGICTQKFCNLLQRWAVRRDGEIFLVGLVELAGEHLMACRQQVAALALYSVVLTREDGTVVLLGCLCADQQPCLGVLIHVESILMLSQKGSASRLLEAVLHTATAAAEERTRE